MAAPSPAEIHYQMEHVHESKASDIIASHVICFVLACIAVVLRFVSRRIGKNAIQADNWFIVAALFFTAAVMADNFVSVHFGLGKHSILIKNPAGIANTIIAGEAIYNAAMACIKFSILLFYRRIFSVSRPFVITLWCVGIFIFGYSTAQTFGAIFQCVPIRSNWDPTIQRKCINTDLAATILAALNVVTDFVILTLPMPLLWRLQTSRKQRYQIMGIFLLGGFVCFASIYRCVVIHSLSLEDTSWSDSSTVVWTMVELGIAIVSACLPTLRPIFSRSIDGLQKLRSNSLGAAGGRKPSDPSWPGDLPLPESASKEGWMPPSPDTITLNAESERKSREISDEV